MPTPIPIADRIAALTTSIATDSAELAKLKAHKPPTVPALTGTARAGTPLKWDFQTDGAVTYADKATPALILWGFDAQAKDVETPAASAPGFEWSKAGTPLVTLTVVDSWGASTTVSKRFTVGAPPAPATTTPRPVPTSLAALPAGIFEAVDFGVSSKAGQAVAPGATFSAIRTLGDVIGKGSTQTRLRVRPKSSTKAKAVPPPIDSTGGDANPTNNLYALRVEGVTRFARGFTLLGTDQGHLYNGIRFQLVNDLTIEDVIVSGIPGNAPGNPGETFAIALHHLAKKGTIRRLGIAGGTGPLASAAGLGLNTCSAAVTIEDFQTLGLTYSAGMATWEQTGPITIHGWRHRGKQRALGAERLAAPIHIVDPEWPDLVPTNLHRDITYTWEAGYDHGSILIDFSSEAALARTISKARPKITTLTNAASRKAGITKSVRVQVAGKDRTSDLHVFVGG